MPSATASAAPRAPTSRSPFSRYATATPGRTACAIASPMKAIERSTTKQPTTAQSTPTITPASMPRCMNSSANGSGSQAITADPRAGSGWWR